jgi:acyl-CoA synthetase (AMP-forming)/AMP-acid ligase II
MIHAHSLGRATRLFPDRAALWSGDRWLTFAELDHRVAGIAGALSRHGFESGDRLAVLMPNGADYLELVYACAWLGVIVVPLNVRLSVVEIDRILADASPHGLIRHSSLPVPTVPLAWRLVLDQEALDHGDHGSRSTPINDPDAVWPLSTPAATGHEGVVVIRRAGEC